MASVLFFGTFDPLHEGHRYAFRESRMLGERLTVVVARDSTIAREKNRPPHQSQDERLALVAADESVDTAMLGDEDPHSYTLLTTIPFDILALGYDQAPSDEQARELLRSKNLSHVRVVRLAPYKPETYKSSLLR